MRPAVCRSIAGATIAVLVLGMGASSGAEPIPAGGTAAVLSFVDAAAGRVEVVRGWPARPADTDVYPFVPYFWGSCPGPGAIMMLVALPAGPAPLAAIAGRIASGFDLPLPGPRPSGEIPTLARIAAGLRTPGDPALAALAAAAPWISDLGTYERWGYAVFLFIHWEGISCVATFRAVPEGYGIPFVQ
ncbi:MAG TPA: hypothetical protein VGA35_06015 [bacterium]